MPGTSTPIDICNAALTMVGANRIADFDGGTAEQVVASEHYERMVRAALAEHPWRFATELKSLGSPLTDTPAGKWSVAFESPPDLLRAIAVRAGSTNVDFDRFGTKIFTDRNDELTIEYIFRAEEGTWPPHFEEAMVQQLAHRFSVALNRDIELKTEFRKDLVTVWARARLVDSQQQSTRRIEPSRLTAARR